MRSSYFQLKVRNLIFGQQLCVLRYPNIYIVMRSIDKTIVIRKHP